MLLLDYLEGMMDLTSVEAVWDRHVAAMQNLGFDRLLYLYTRNRTAISYGDADDVLILSNHSRDYMKTFIEGGLYSDAPMVRWAADNVGACSWGMIFDDPGPVDPAEARVIEFNRRHGVTAGYTISFKDISSRAKGGIGLVVGPDEGQARADEIWRRHGRAIIQMNNVAHLKISGLPHVARKKRLTARQREVLEWVGDGKTVQDIATIMGLTAATVDKHLRLARSALNVDTTAQAVLKASSSNQIFVIEG